MMETAATGKQKGKKRSRPASLKERLPLLARLQINADIPSLNDLISGAYKRRLTPSRMKRQWRERLWELQMEQLGIDWKNKIEVTQKHPRRRLEIIRRCKRLLDEDNLRGGVKPVVDALKSENEKVYGKIVGRSAGWFYDDSKTYLDLHVIQLQIGEAPWVELILYGHADEKK